MELLERRRGLNAEFIVPPVPADGSYPLVVEDTLADTSTASLEVFTDPAVGPLTARPAAVDVGQSVSIDASATGGSGNLSTCCSRSSTRRVLRY